MDVEGSITPENYLGEKEIMDIVRQLPTGYSKVFQMAVIEGYSHKEIAERMGIEPHSSSSQLARAKAMLRKMISKRMLAVVTIIFISIPICRVLWRKDKAKEKNNHTAQVKNEDKGQYIEPSLHWYVPNGSSVHTIWTEHPFTFTVPFGLRFTW